ncbi:MAG: alpha-ketoacid dehydrogenase subunit beta [Candidatus Manganitrophaceae bacterium]|nr:MAG: alpha-ketoacid dehydrogenase subunit beta [Candidatus Manganitrophaceae bacterium]
MPTTYIKAIHDAMFEEMKRDENVFLLGEDVGILGGAFKATEGFLQEFGAERVIDTPIAESLIVGAAIGAAVLGMRPIAEMQFADFISCAYDQIINMAATLRYRHGGRAQVPMVIRGPSGAGVHGGLFHSQNPESYFFSVPGLKIVTPATAYDAKGLLKASIRDNDPVLFFEHKYLYRRIQEELPEEDYIVPLGKAAIRREGSDMTFITYSAMLYPSLAAAERLEKEDGLHVEVIDLRSLRPLDWETVFQSVRKTSKAVIIHEDRRTGGVGGEIAARIVEECFDSLDGPIVRVASEDTHYAFSPPLEEFILPNVDKILAKARTLAAY